MEPTERIDLLNEIPQRVAALLAEFFEQHAIPSYRVKEHDIVTLREKSKELTPFVVAQAQAGSRPVPAWLEPIPSEMKILIHTLPARAVIDTQVQEQLIVELYSK